MRPGPELLDFSHSCSHHLTPTRRRAFHPAHNTLTPPQTAHFPPGPTSGRSVPWLILPLSPSTVSRHHQHHQHPAVQTAPAPSQHPPGTVPAPFPHPSCHSVIPSSLGRLPTPTRFYSFDLSSLSFFHLAEPFSFCSWLFLFSAHWLVPRPVASHLLSFLFPQLLAPLHSKQDLGLAYKDSLVLFPFSLHSTFRPSSASALPRVPA